MSVTVTFYLGGAYLAFIQDQIFLATIVYHYLKEPSNTFAIHYKKIRIHLH